MESPKPTGRPPQSITLTGTVFPWDGTGPVFLRMPGSDQVYLPCFADAGSLESVLGHYGVCYESIKRIDNEHDFLVSVTHPGVAVILNPRLTDTGRLRFLQVV